MASREFVSWESKIVTCDFCGKIFSSGKALGGHRRCHLQKLKNGGVDYIKSPPSTEQVSDPVAEEEGCTDLTKALPCWVVKGKRGRTGIPHSPSRAEDQEEKVLPLKKRRIEECHKYVCSACDRSFDNYQALGGHMSHHNRDRQDHYSVSEQSDASAVYEGCEIDLSQQSPTTDGVTTPGCEVNRSHQSPTDDVTTPGGEINLTHQSSIGDTKKVSEMNLTHQSPTDNVTDEGCEISLTLQCPACEKIFTTSQDLEAHKRDCHSRVQVNEEMRQVEEARTKRPLFDLNKLPEEEMEDQEEEGSLPLRRGN
ncbi:hypothetical protein LguiA_012564 [Lonicera macranthoides]